MPDTPESKAEQIIDSAKAKIQEEVAIVKNSLSINKNVFYLALALVGIAIGVILFFVYKGIAEKDRQIQAFTLKMSQRDAQVKSRDLVIDSLDKANKSKDAFLVEARDSIDSAYKILNTLNSSQNTQNEKHRKDSIAISRLSLADKLRIITGGSR